MGKRSTFNDFVFTLIKLKQAVPLFSGDRQPALRLFFYGQGYFLRAPKFTLL
jgi:hypothetical protein